MTRAAETDQDFERGHFKTRILFFLNLLCGRTCVIVSLRDSLNSRDSFHRQIVYNLSDHGQVESNDIRDGFVTF